MFPDSSQKFPMPALNLRPAILALAVALAYPFAAHAEEGTDVAQDTQSSAYGEGERAVSQSVMAQINAAYAHARGITGRGVTIAVLDTGIDASHPELAASGKVLPGFNAVDGSADTADARGHGTHVAGLLSGARDGRGMYGLAYDARLLPVKVFPNSGSGSTAFVERGIRYAIGRASIINMSFGTPGEYTSRAMQEAVDAGLLVVAAAGNRGNDNPEWPARFAREGWARNRIIAVGAVDADNRIASFSNRAGDTAAWYIVAPGVDLPSTYLDGRYAYMGGTSMATAVVSGAAALLKQQWNYLRADQIASVLLVTATDLGAPGIDPVYGRGLLNVEKALQPVGTLKTSSWNGTPIRVLDTSLRPSAATSALWTFAAAGDLRMAALDDFDRDFATDLGTTVARPTALSLDQAFDNIDRRLDIADRVLGDGGELSLAFDRNDRHGRADRDGRSGFSLVARNGAGLEFAFGRGRAAARQFGIASMPAGSAFAMLPQMTNPYFSLVPDALQAALGYGFGDGFVLRAGMLGTDARQYPPTSAGAAVAVRKSALALIELARTFADTAVSLSLARTRESDSFLGAQSRGAFAFGTDVASSALQLACAWRMAPGVALAGQAAYGVTPRIAMTNSLIVDTGTIRSNAFALALVGSGRFVRGDRVSIALSQPMRTFAGSMRFDVLAGVEGDGTALRERRSFSMVPAAREVMTEFAYVMPHAHDASTALSMSLRRHPNHFEDAPSEKLLAVRYAQPF
jgi:hypothetical protein